MLPPSPAYTAHPQKKLLDPALARVRLLRVDDYRSTVVADGGGHTTRCSFRWELIWLGFEVAIGFYTDSSHEGFHGLILP